MTNVSGQFLRWLLGAYLLLGFSTAQAGAAIAAGQPLPPLLIEEQGELLLEDGRRQFRPWHSDSGLGQPQVIQYMAARMSTSKLNEPLTDALQAAAFPPDSLRVTTILNLADAAWGTRGFVLGELESNKKKHPQAVLVADESGAGLNRWQLAAKNSAIAVVAPDGAIALFHEGPLDEAGIDRVLSMIHDWIDVQ
ncbi:MAG: YtfJ family protein [Haliea sp.]|uniref:YtfJ family protein n=1 Tax=Haliea sp. TaxID=1932666 RepID=UPI0032ED9CEE